jgi:hypothetical protein
MFAPAIIQPLEENVMKIMSLSTPFAVAAFLLSIGFAGAAQDPQNSLEPITVKHHAATAVAPAAVPQAGSLDCTPPNDAPACAAFHSELRRRFNERELSMLFGAATSDPAYLSSYSKVSQRYQNFLHDYNSNQNANAVAIK